MANSGDQKNSEENQPSDLGLTHPVAPSRKGGSNLKFYAVIVVLIVIVAAFGILAFYHPSTSGTQGTVISAASVASLSTPYNLTIHTNGKYNYAEIFWGDGTTSIVSYNGTDTIQASHNYTSPGDYLVFYTVNFGSYTYTSSNDLVQLVVTLPPTSQVQDDSFGQLALIGASSPTLVNGSYAYAPGTTLNFTLSYFTEPENTSYQVIQQSVTIYRNGTQISNYLAPYEFNSTLGAYELPQSESFYNLSSLNSGYYIAKVTTETTSVNSTGTVNVSSSAYSTNYYLDIFISYSAKAYQPSTSSGVFVNDELSPGGYTTLDYALQDTTLGQEVIDQNLQYLVAFNGSSDTSFEPELASALPTIANGGINNNYANYTVHVPASVAGYSATYEVHIKPYENYTFHIRSNATFANGMPVTAWDFKYSIARLLLLNNATNSQGGYMSNLLLPGNVYESNTFWNITQNITVDNATNNITFHLQSPEPPAVVYQEFATDGSEAEPAAWYIAHGAGINWSPNGFKAYQIFGLPGHYNTYVQNNIMSDGPYMILYQVPSAEVVMIANPNFKSPGPWDPAPKIDKIVIQYMSEESSVYINLKSGFAQAGTIPSTDWPQVQTLLGEGLVKVYSYPSISLTFFNYNANITESSLHSLDSLANVPQYMFVNPNARKALSYLFNYNLYYNQQVGNAIYHTLFKEPYAGYLPNGSEYEESIGQLNSTGTPIPYFDPAIAQSYWNAFMNSSAVDSGKNMGISYSGGIAMYGGAQLSIPVFIPEAHPALLAAASTWISDMQKYIGVTGQVEPVTEDFIFSATQGANPFTIVWGGWSSSFAFPNRFISLALPTNETSYEGAMEMVPYFIASHGGIPVYNNTEAAYMNSTISAWENATANSTNPILAKYWYDKANGMIVNLTLVVFIGQEVGKWIISSKINSTTFAEYQENPFLAGVGRLMYAALQYN